VEEVAEPFLVRSGLLARTPRGRIATPAAWAHLGMVPPRAVIAMAPSLFDEDSSEQPSEKPAETPPGESCEAAGEPGG
jgi:hypothetical protein